MRKLVAAMLLLGAVGVAALAWGAWSAFHDDDAATAGGHLWSVGEAREFEEFPLFWVGERHQGQALMQVVRTNWVGKRTTVNSADFIYGDCVIPPGETGCPVPLTIIVSPGCKPAPGEIVDAVKEGPEQTIRGAKVQMVSSGAVIWTQGVTVNVATTGEVDVGQVISALVRLNGDGEPSTAQEQLGPSDDCQ